MSHELEAVGGASLGGLTSGTHHPVGPPGEPCRNCGAVVAERYCTRCGQLASNFHRPFFSLIASSVADTFALDGRLWRTVPMLLFRPGRLTRNYLDGKRARYVPPFRLFLLSSVIFFLTVFSVGEMKGWYADWHLGNGNVATLAEEDKAAAVRALEAQLAQEGLTPDQRSALEESVARLREGALPFVDADGRVDRDALHEAIGKTANDGATEAEIRTLQAAGDKFARVFENQDRFAARFREWAPRFSLMFVPLLALMLSLLYAWRRNVYVYDHVITALHFQTFVYTLVTLLLFCAAFLGIGPGWLITIGATWIVYYLYGQVRVTYGTGRFMAALRTSILLFLGITVLIIMALGLVLLSFALT